MTKRFFFLQTKILIFKIKTNLNTNKSLKNKTMNFFMILNAQYYVILDFEILFVSK